MKFLKIKKAYRIIYFLIIIAFMFQILSACNKTQTTKTSPIETKREAELDIEKIKQKSIEVATLYKNLYLNIEKTKSEYFPYATELSQDGIDKIEEFLILKGYAVINSDSKYPAYLENSKSFYKFWDSVSSKKTSSQDIISISSAGGLFYTSFQYYDDIKYKIGIAVEWNENNEPFVSLEENYEISDWDLINETNFYYKTNLNGVPYDDYSLIRLEQDNKNLYDLNAKYILPIGYANNNMFVSEWTYQNYNELCFNDLLEPFYKLKNNEYFPQDDYPLVREPYIHSYIPAELFESTIKPFFVISLQEFRKRCLYDKEKNIYPWQEIGGANLSTYPRVESEVIKCRDNNDGTITLTVNARCNEYKTPCLFTHEVTIQVINNNEYHYLSNKITYKSEHELPPNQPRLPPQRFKQ